MLAIHFLSLCPWPEPAQERHLDFLCLSSLDASILRASANYTCCMLSIIDNTTKFCTSFLVVHAVLRFLFFVLPGGPADGASSRLVSSRWSFVNLNLVEGWRLDPLQGACCCLNCCSCVSKSHSNSIVVCFLAKRFAVIAHHEWCRRLSHPKRVRTTRIV